MGKVAVIVPTYGRAAVLAETLQAVKDQLTEEDLLIVVDDGSKNLESARCADYYVWQPDRGYRLATARNVGARIALSKKVDLLIFLDADLVPQEEWLSAFLKARDDGAHVIFGMINMTPTSLPKDRPWLGVTGGNMAVTTEAWQKVGDFDERYNGCWGVEDTDWAYRAMRVDYVVTRLLRGNCLHRAHKPRENWQEEQKTNWAKFAEKFSDVGLRPEPHRTDTITTSPGPDLLDDVWIVTPTKNRPEEAERWAQERFSWGLPVIIVDDNDSPDPVEYPEHVKDVYTCGAGISMAMKLGIAFACTKGAKYIIELDDHDSLRDGLVDLQRICKLLKNGVDYIYGNYSLNYERRRHKPVFTDDYRRGMLAERGMCWMGVKAYSVDAYKDVGGYKPDEFPAGDYSLALRFEVAGKIIMQCPELWTDCPMPPDGLTGSRNVEVKQKVDEYREKYQEGLQKKT